MKPPPFRYHRPPSLDEALAVLAEVGHDGKVLAGGQSLLPLLSMRLAAPAHLVDINRLDDLAFVRSGPEGVRVGALARHAAVERDAAAAGVQPLLRQALRLVAHPTIRNRGTSVGSLAHADPSGELTAVLALTGGHVTLASTGGRRDVPAADFFLGPLESAISPGELAVEAFFPAFGPRTGTAFLEVSRRHGDYAMAGVAAAVGLDEAGEVVSARTAYLTMGPVPAVVDVLAVGTAAGLSAPKGPRRRPARTTSAANASSGRGGRARSAALRADDPAAWEQLAQTAVAGLAPEDDIHATAAYRSRLARVLTGRALAEAAARALTAAKAAPKEDAR